MNPYCIGTTLQQLCPLLRDTYQFGVHVDRPYDGKVPISTGSNNENCEEDFVPDESAVTLAKRVQRIAGLKRKGLPYFKICFGKPWTTKADSRVSWTVALLSPSRSRRTVRTILP